MTVVPIAKEAYDRKDEQNFREYTRRNVQQVEDLSSKLAEVDALLLEMISVLVILYNKTARIDYADAPPTTGANTQGNILFHLHPAVGQPKGWVCTVSGTPGTWVSMGNL